LSRASEFNSRRGAAKSTKSWCEEKTKSNLGGWTERGGVGCGRSWPKMNWSSGKIGSALGGEFKGVVRKVLKYI